MTRPTRPTRPVTGPTADGDVDRPPTLEEIEGYAAAVRRAVVRSFSGRPPLGGFSADDVAQEVVLRFLEAPVRVMRAYREPWVFARVSATSRLVDLGRRDRVQRGEGVRLVDTSSGTRPRRVAVWLDAPTARSGDAHDDLRLTEPQSSVEDVVLDRLAVDDLLASLSDADRRLVEYVDLLQFSVTEVAQMEGLRRETVSRRLAALRRSLVDAVGQVAP